MAQHHIVLTRIYYNFVQRKQLAYSNRNHEVENLCGL